MPSRRQFCLAAGAAAAAPALLARLAAAARTRPDRGRFEVAELRPGAWAVIGGGGNALILATEAGPVLVDTKHAQLGRPIANQVAATAGELAALVINTHHHADHTGGNWAFRSTATVWGHRNLAPRIEGNLERYRNGATQRIRELRDAGADRDALEAAQRTAARLAGLDASAFVPDEFFGVEKTIEHGGVEIRLLHAGAGHTDNDAIVHVPALDLVHAGDLVFHKLHPYVDVAAGATTTGWQRSLAAARELCGAGTVVVPGHGAITDRAGLDLQDRYFRTLRDVVRQQIRTGATRETVATLRPATYANYGLDRLRPIALRAIYDELTAE